MLPVDLAAAFGEHVLVLSRGRPVAARHPVDVLRPALLREVRGVDADVLEHPHTGRPVIAFARSVPVDR
jgi:iron complex transport system ATP-binding protein